MNKDLKYILKANITVKTLSIMLVAVMLFSTAPIFAVASEPDKIIKNFSFSTPEIIQDGDYIKIKIDNLDSTLMEGEPQLPVLKDITKLPYEAKDIEVTFEHSPEKTFTFDGTIAPGPKLELLPDGDYPIITKIISAYSKLFSRESSNIIQKKTTNNVESLNKDIYVYGVHDDYFHSEIFVGRDTKTNEITNFVLTTITPLILEGVGECKYIEDATVTISYTQGPEPLDEEVEEYDLLILSPSGYLADLQPLVDHKKEMGFDTKLVCLDDIYDETYFELTEGERNSLRDEQETIKYFIYNAIEKWDVSYVLAIGGWRTLFGLNVPSRQFPIRYSHCDDGEPGYVADQYYSCCIAAGGEFDTWDSNGNDRFAEWDSKGWDKYDPFPDVYFGRLACRNRGEVKTMVNKIIHYETTTYGQEWFSNFLSVTGDGFGDLEDLAVNWDTNVVPSGDYKIFAQSELQSDSSVKGPIDEVKVFVDHTAPSKVTFYEDDHLKIEPLTDDQETLYPGKPVAEIVAPQDNNVLGNTDVSFNPPEAYISDATGWGRVDYIDGIMSIRSKSYDPSPHSPDYYSGSNTIIKIWIENNDEDIIFGPVTRASSTYYEGEIEASAAINFASGGDYDNLGPDLNEINKIWTSNGGWYTMWDVLNAFSEGYGLAYVNGHSSCMSFGDHYPGIPGGRDDGQARGIASINMRFGLARYAAEEGDPLFPLDQLTNGDKLPILLYSGCHSGQFDTSFASLFYDPYNVLFGDRYGTWTPEGVAWWITRLPQGGSIATIGNTGLGKGAFMPNTLDAVTGYIYPQFFFNYNAVGGPHLDEVGPAHTQTLIDYAIKDDAVNVLSVRKHFEQLALLGDPSLKIGGYPSETKDTKYKTLDNEILEYDEISDLSLDFEILKNVRSLGSGYQVTYNPAVDTNPESIISSEDGDFLVGYAHEASITGDVHAGFAYSSGGSAWNEMIIPTAIDTGHTYLDSWEDEKGTHHVGSVCFGPNDFGAMMIPDITNPDTWSSPKWIWVNSDVYSGRYGLAVTGFTDEHGNLGYGGVWTGCALSGFGVHAMFDIPSIDYEEGGMIALAPGIPSNFSHFAGDADASTGWHFWTFQEVSGQIYMVRGTPPDTFHIATFLGTDPDVAADDGYAYVVYENGGSIECRISTNNGISWTIKTVTGNGNDPQLIINEDGSVECYYVRDNSIYKSVSETNGLIWTEVGQIADVEVDGSVNSPFAINTDGMVFDKGDGDLYAEIYTLTTNAMIDDIELHESGKKVTTSIINSGTQYFSDTSYEIKIEGDSPLGLYFGGSPLLMTLFQGRIISGGYTSENVYLSPTESQKVESNPVFGIGHVEITVTVHNNEEDTILAERSEDGFLLGGRILLIYPEE